MNKLRTHSIRFINTKILNNVKIFINELIFLDQKHKFYRQKFFRVLFSRNVNEVIRTVLNFFFLQKDFTRTKCTKRIQANKKKKGSRAILNFFFLRKDFTRTKSTKRIYANKMKKRQHFFELKKHLRGRKPLIHLFAFCPFYAFYAFCAFAWLHFCAFCACKIFS